jgi:hypothetical protein
MYHLQTTIEISASPVEVREKVTWQSIAISNVRQSPPLFHTCATSTNGPELTPLQFLDFSKIPIYHPNGFFKSIGPAVPNTPLEPDVKMRNVLEGMTFEPTLLVGPRLSALISAFS